MLRKEFLGPMELTPYRLAKDIGVPLTRITAILAGKRAITADTGLRLDRYFGLSEGWWLRLQTECDIRTARRSPASELAAIIPRRGVLPPGSVRDCRWAGSLTAFGKNATAHDMDSVRASIAAGRKKLRAP